MKLVCPLSSIVWSAEGFATGHKKLVMQHPIFSAPLDNLVARYSTDYLANKLSPEEKHLLLLAFLKATNKVKFLVPATPSEATVAANMDRLVSCVSWMNSLRLPATALPDFSINRGTKQLDNLGFWLEAWEQARSDFDEGRRIRVLEETKSKLEFFLERKLQRIQAGLASESASYLEMLANWAEIATTFPNFGISHPLTGETIKLSTYWKELIQSPESKWYSYPIQDWKELEDHIIDSLDNLDTIFGLALLRKLRKIINRTTSDLGLILVELPNYGTGDGNSVSNASSDKRTYSYGSTAGDLQAMQNLAAKAPSSEPKLENYPSRAAYLQAKIAWGLAQKLASKDLNNGAAPTVEDL